MDKLSSKELKKACREFSKGILGGNGSFMQCGKVSYALQGFLSFAFGLKTRVCEGDVGDSNHVWLEMQDGRVIDCTADQFNGNGRKHPQVYIGEPLDIHGLCYKRSV